MTANQAAKKDQLQRDLGPVVDCIRGIPRDEVNLADVLTLAEVMVGSMRSFFTNLDTAVYKELTGIADFIENAKSEIGALQPRNIKNKHIPLAGKELDAIVKATEEATNTIMERAETIMGADPADAEAYHETVQASVMDIFEACSFQDITGQRISKVVETLTHIEDRITRLADTLGHKLEETDIEETAEERRRRELLLHGPALEGEGVDQSEVDALLNYEPPADDDSGGGDGPGDGGNDKASSQSDIDALFD